jgi:hypothetical protein
MQITCSKVRRRGSSLVIVLLSIAASSVVILAGAGALINTVRQRGSTESRFVAEQMADSALQLAYFLYENRSRGGLPQNHEQYGTPAGTGQDLFAKKHGFTPGTECKEFNTSTTVTTIDAACPSFDLAVRTVVTPQDPTVGYAFSSREIPILPGNTYVRMRLPAFTSTVTLRVNTLACNGCTFEVQPLNAAAAAVGGPLILGPNPVFLNTGQGIAFFNIRATNYNTGTNGTNHRQVVTITSPDPFTVSTGFISIDATGLAADGTRVGKLAIIRRYDTTDMADTTPSISKRLKTITQQFTPAGYCSPTPDVCR